MDGEYAFDFIAGWIGGCMGLLAGHPMDTIKVRQQTMGSVSVMKGVTNTFKYEGIRGFYKGLGFPLLAAGTLNSVFFGFYGNSIRYLSQGKVEPSYRDIFMSGCIGGFAQLFVACPVDLVKIKLQMQTGGDSGVWEKHYSSNYKGPTACIKDIYRKRGIRGCYTGFNSMLPRDVAASALYFMLYEMMVDRDQGLSAVSILWAGGMAGVLSWSAILPLDVIKSRIQGDDPVNPKYKNSIDCLVKSYRQEGLKVFTKGFIMMSVRAFPTNAAIFLGYETSLVFLKKLSKAFGPDGES